MNIINKHGKFLQINSLDIHFTQVSFRFIGTDMEVLQSFGQGLVIVKKAPITQYKIDNVVQTDRGTVETWIATLS